MELEDQWWKGQLAADIYQALRCKELKLPSYKGQSPQLNLRRYFADLIAIICNRFCLCPAARHLAVYLLDLFMDRYDVTMQQLHMVSLSCLLLASMCFRDLSVQTLCQIAIGVAKTDGYICQTSKFEEREDCVPKLETLNSLGCMSSMNLVLTKQGLLHMELLLLETFSWNLYLPTAAHFIDYYLSVGVLDGDLHDGWPMASLEKTKLYMAKYTDYFLEVSLQDHIFLCFAPSLVAAACVAASRLILHLSPSWPARLQRLTGYAWENLTPCVEKLLIAHDSDVKEASKQQQSQSLLHSSGQPAAVSQFLQLPSMQFAQKVPQAGLAAVHRSASYPQGPGGPQQSDTQASAACLDPKPSVPSRAFPVSMHYSYQAPCFDR